MSSEKVGVVVPDDIVEQILVRLDLKDLIQCKTVCKSWRSLVSCSRFAVSHFIKHSDSDTYDNTKRRRIFINEDHLRKHLVGSSNGLVCFFTRNAEIIVANPLTRELKKLESPDDDDDEVLVIRNDLSFLGGFGYDSSSDDFKVILGRREYKEGLMRFHVLSLKSNVWKFAGDLKCSFICMLPDKEKDSCGILCNGALHWFVLDQHKNPVILSFNLSTEEFKETPQPDDTNYKYTTYSNHRLGMVEESLCIFRDDLFSCWKIKDQRGRPKWVMKNYNGKQCWELHPHHAQWDNDVALRLKMLKFYNRVEESFFHEGKQCMLKTKEYISAPIYVQSLVSPQVYERTKSRVSHHVNGRSMGHVSPHVSGGLKRKRHTPKNEY